jgi:hypothetical protein
MRNSIHDLAQEALFLAGRQCDVCSIPGGGTPLYFAGTEDGRTGYRPHLDQTASWRDWDTGEPIEAAVEWDEFPPTEVRVDAYNLSRSNRVPDANIVVRCERHKPRGGRRVE